MARVTNLDNGKKAVLRINDRGPFHEDRVIDLSYAAAQALGFVDEGTAPVVVEAMDALNYPGPRVATEAGPGESKSPAGTYYLQVGAFAEESGAREMQKRLKELMVTSDSQYPVTILESQVRSGMLHKVWIGPIISTINEQDLALMIREADIGDPIRVELD